MSSDDLLRRMGIVLNADPNPSVANLKELIRRRMEVARQYDAEVARRKAKVDMSPGPEHMQGLTNQNLRDLSEMTKQQIIPLAVESLETAKKNQYREFPLPVDSSNPYLEYKQNSTLGGRVSGMKNIGHDITVNSAASVGSDFQEANSSNRGSRESSFGIVLKPIELQLQKQFGKGGVGGTVGVSASGPGAEVSASTKAYSADIGGVQIPGWEAETTAEYYPGKVKANAGFTIPSGTFAGLTDVIDPDRQAHAIMRMINGEREPDEWCVIGKAEVDKSLGGLGYSVGGALGANSKGGLSAKAKGSVNLFGVGLGADLGLELLPPEYCTPSKPADKDVFEEKSKIESQPENYLLAENFPKFRGKPVDDFTAVYPLDESDGQSGAAAERNNSNDLPPMSIVRDKVFLGGDPKDPSRWATRQYPYTGGGF